MAIEIQLSGDTNITVITREEINIVANKISIDSITDDGCCVVCRVSFFNPSGYVKELILWDGEDYANIGNWTNEEVSSRIKILLNI